MLPAQLEFKTEILFSLRFMLPRSKEKEWSDFPGMTREFFAYFKLPNTVLLTRNLIYAFLKSSLDPQGNNSILDVGCGGGDLLEYLAIRLEKDGFQSSLTGIDADAAAVSLAKARTEAFGNVRVICGRAEKLEGFYDMAVMSLFLHHHSPRDASNMLRFLCGRVSRKIVISDFVRSRTTYWLVKAFVYLTTVNKIHRHDGPLSVLRSYTDKEIRWLMREAGICSFTIRDIFLRKFVVIRRADAAAPTVRPAVPRRDSSLTSSPIGAISVG